MIASVQIPREVDHEETSWTDGAVRDPGGMVLRVAAPASASACRVIHGAGE
jgi:hypothetical protein